MIPIRDNIPSRTTPMVNYSIIGLCALVYLAQTMEKPNEPSLVERFGMIPARVLHPEREVTIKRYQRVEGQLRVVEKTAAPAAIPVWLTLPACIFLHGSLLHVVGNMWFLYIFGDNVEDRLGHLGYLAFYVGCGSAASLSHLLAAPDSTVPTIGASGAIAGVMGAYFLFYPRAKVLSVVPVFVILHMVVLPAPLFLGIWFLFQFLQAAMSGAAGAGVAWWAHIGGFIAGLVVAWLLSQSGALRPPVETVRPRTEHTGAYRIGPRRRNF